MQLIAEKLKQYLLNFGKKKALFVCGLIGLFLLGFSQVSTSKKTDSVAVSSGQSDADYCAETEQKIKQLVMAITGDENCVVAVTLNTGTEYVYANQTTTDTNVTEDSNSDQSTLKESRKNAQEYIIMKSENGTEQPLTVTEKKPEIRGVAIVTGGLNVETAEQIEAGVAAMLNLSTRRISITKKAKQFEGEGSNEK